MSGTGVERWKLERLYQRITAEVENEYVGLPFQTVLNRIAQRVTDQLPASLGASVILWDAATERFTTASSTVGGQTAELPVKMVRTTGGASRWVIDEQEPVIIPDTADDPFGANPMITEFGVRAYVGVPILIRDEAVGVLYALDDHERHYTEPEVMFLERLARRAAVEINTARQLGEAATMREHAAALEQVATSLIEADTLEELFRAAVDIVAETLPADRVVLVTLDERRRVVIDHVLGGPGADVIGQDTFEELMSGLTGWALRTWETVLSESPDDEREPAALRRRRIENQAGAVIVAPMRYRDSTLGTLTAVRRIDEPLFTAVDADLLEAIANQSAIAIANARLAQSIHAGTASGRPEAIARRLYESLRQGDMATTASLLAADAEWEVPGRSVIAGVYRGRGAMFDHFARIGTLTEGTFRVELVDIFGSTTAAIAAVDWSARCDGRAVSSSSLIHLSVDRGMVVRLRVVPEDQYAFDEFWGVAEG